MLTDFSYNTKPIIKRVCVNVGIKEKLDSVSCTVNPTWTSDEQTPKKKKISLLITCR